MIFRPVMTLKEAQEEDDAKEIRRFAIEKELQEKGLPIKTPMGYEEERKAAPLKHLRHKTKKLVNYRRMYRPGLRRIDEKEKRGV
jgi:hypothetical protein